MTNGKICDNTQCKDLSMCSFPIQTDESICFKDIAGEILQIKIHESVSKLRYKKMYLTTDYDIHTNSYWNCKGGGECWEGGCYKGMKYRRFGNRTFAINGYDCNQDSIGCESMCFHKNMHIYTLVVGS